MFGSPELPVTFKQSSVPINYDENKLTEAQITINMMKQQSDYQVIVEFSVNHFIIEIFQLEKMEKTRDSFFLKNLFAAFCVSTTLHGIAYWHRATTLSSRRLWAFITFCGIAMSGHFIYEGK